MSNEETKNIISEHQKWINGEGGSRANLSGANLSGANLSGANLSGAKKIISFGPMPTSGRIVYAARHDSGVIMVKAGCFWGTVSALRQKVKHEHNCPVYLAVCDMLESSNFKFNGE